MAIRDIFKISRKTFFNPSGWLDYDSLKSQNITIIESLKGLFSVPQPEREESFAEAKKRLGLTDEDIALGAKRYRQYAIGFVLLALAVFIYSFFLLFRYSVISGWLLGLAVTGLLLAQAFRFDFWSFQMRKRKLGATFTEWKNDILGETRTSL